jgi:protoheme IX farnesyltransferase
MQIALRSFAPRWRAYVELTKPRVVALMIFTVVVGMLLATTRAIPWHVWLFAPLGIALVAGRGAALNHWSTGASTP